MRYISYIASTALLAAVSGNPSNGRVHLSRSSICAHLNWLERGYKYSPIPDLGSNISLQLHHQPHH